MPAPGFPFVLPLSLLLAVAAGCSKPPGEKPAANKEAEVPVTVAPVRMQPYDRTIPVVGTLFPKDEATVSAEVEGPTARESASPSVGPARDRKSVV